MRDWKSVRERYMRDSLPVRLGNLATSLARIHSFAAHDQLGETTQGVLEETRHYTEWIDPDTALEHRAQLVELKSQLDEWQENWNEIWADPTLRRCMAEQAGLWSGRVLDFSGLLTTPLATSHRQEAGS